MSRILNIYTGQLLFYIALMTQCTHSEKRNNPNQEIIEPIMITSPSSAYSSLPYLSVGNNRLLLSWVVERNDTSTLWYSYTPDTIWSEPEQIISGSDWFVNWADFPSITENNDAFLAHFLKKSSPATFSYDVFLTIKNKADSVWLPPFKLHSDTTKTEHGFVSVIPYDSNTFLINWLDGRNTTGHHDPEESMTLRSAIVDTTGKIVSEHLLDDKVCDCCQTTTAMTNKGPVVLYRNRSESEIRDIQITRLNKGVWSDPLTIHPDNWKIMGCPVNGPNVSAFGDILAVAWFTAAEDQSQVKLAFSQDAGISFGDAVIIDDDNPLGRVGVQLINEETALICWMAEVGDEAHIKMMRVNINGEKSSPVTIASTQSSRISGFPQMKIFNNKVYFAWTKEVGDNPVINMAYLTLEKLLLGY